MERFIPLSVPNIKGNEKEYVVKALDEEWVSTAGECINIFEKKLAEYVESEGAVACQSGTAGLHLALRVCGVGAGDMVIVPTLTFVAAVNPVKYLNAEPIFMDCDDSLTVDAFKVRKFVEEECEFDGEHLRYKKNGKIIRAIVVVHVFGNMADMHEIISIAKKYNIKVIEDATEALGTRYLDDEDVPEDVRGKFAGTMGDVGVYSFNGNKIITTGGGGMVVSNCKEYLDRVKYLSTQAKDDTLYFVHGDIGYNYRMTNIQAAMGIGQLERLEEFIETKNRNYDRYVSNGINLLEFKKNIRSNKWFYSYLCKDRDGLIKKLSEMKIQTRPIWMLIHHLKPYEDAECYMIEKAEKYYKKIVNIPCSTGLTLEDVDYVSERINRIEERLNLN